MITHVVLFKLKDASAARMEETRARLDGLRGAVGVLKSLEVGVDVIRSERSYDLALIATFESLADLETYQKHPAHQDVLDVGAGGDHGPLLSA